MKSIFSKKQNKKGFTLIELLVVIAVIGMLASIVLVSLGPARAKARDSKRISDVRQMSLAFEAEAADGGDVIATCTGVDANVNTCSGPGSADFAAGNAFIDPSEPDQSTLCATASVPCQYSVSDSNGGAGANTDNYQICFYLEQDQDSLGLTTGLNKISTGGVFSAGCN
jgi:prepilin-type N-terminal cleavage/methylation domain-containing protein